MKTSVLDFIESNTLRQHLRGQQLEPAIECILIAQCCTRSLIDKLEALQERYDTYSTEDFKKGVYNSWADDFKSTLKEYISIKHDQLAELYIVNDNEVYVIDADYSGIHMSVWKTLEATVKLAKNELEDDGGCTIIKRRIDDSSYNKMKIFLNSNKEIYNISVLDSAETDFETEYSIQNAYAELPHLYKVGDILRYWKRYAVVVNVIRYETLPEYMKHSDDTDMCLLCLGYYEDSVHSCGGSFCHEHIPLLNAELCAEDELPERYRPLIAVSRLYKGELKAIDFLEMYSNGCIEELL